MKINNPAGDIPGLNSKAMTKDEQKKIVAIITADIANELHNKIDAGRVPEQWNGFELRQWVKDKAAECAYRKMARKRMNEYKNTVLINNL